MFQTKNIPIAAALLLIPLNALGLPFGQITGAVEKVVVTPREALNEALGSLVFSSTLLTRYVQRGSGFDVLVYGAEDYELAAREAAKYVPQTKKACSKAKKIAGNERLEPTLEERVYKSDLTKDWYCSFAERVEDELMQLAGVRRLDDTAGDLITSSRVVRELFDERDDLQTLRYTSEQYTEMLDHSAPRFEAMRQACRSTPLVSDDSMIKPNLRRGSYDKSWTKTEFCAMVDTVEEQLRFTTEVMYLSETVGAFMSSTTLFGLYIQQGEAFDAAAYSLAEYDEAKVNATQKVDELQKACEETPGISDDWVVIPVIQGKTFDNTWTKAEFCAFPKQIEPQLNALAQSMAATRSSRMSEYLDEAIASHEAVVKQEMDSLCAYSGLAERLEVARTELSDEADRFEEELAGLKEFMPSIDDTPVLSSLEAARASVETASKASLPSTPNYSTRVMGNSGRGSTYNIELCLHNEMYMGSPNPWFSADDQVTISGGTFRDGTLLLVGRNSDVDSLESTRLAQVGKIKGRSNDYSVSRFGKIMRSEDLEDGGYVITYTATSSMQGGNRYYGAVRRDDKKLGCSIEEMPSQAALDRAIEICLDRP